MSPATVSSQSGFSLIEMIVAVGLFALIGMAGLSLDQSILTAHRRSEDRLERLGQIQRAVRLLATDLSGAAPRSLALSGNALTMIRADGEGRPIVIAYALVDKSVVRTVDFLRFQSLLPGVTGVRWRFHRHDLGWREDFGGDGRDAPDGLSVQLITEDFGDIITTVDLKAEK